MDAASVTFHFDVVELMLMACNVTCEIIITVPSMIIYLHYFSYLHMAALMAAMLIKGGKKYINFDLLIMCEIDHA